MNGLALEGGRFRVRGIQLERGLQRLNALPKCMEFAVQHMNIPQHLPGGIQDDLGSEACADGNNGCHDSTMRIN